MDIKQLKNVLEGALFASEQPLTLNHMAALFDEDAGPSHAQLSRALEALAEDCIERGVELKQVASGFRMQVRSELQPWVARLWQQRPPRYSRALMETLALIAYRQPMTRGEIEEIRGVAVSSNIMRTLQEREWVRIVGHRDVPGKPALYGTTRSFLDYFNLTRLDELPTLAEIRDLTNLEPELDLDPDNDSSESGNQSSGDLVDEPQLGSVNEAQDLPAETQHASDEEAADAPDTDEHETTEDTESGEGHDAKS